MPGGFPLSTKEGVVRHLDIGSTPSGVAACGETEIQEFSLAWLATLQDDSRCSLVKCDSDAWMASNPPVDCGEEAVQVH